MAPRRAPVLIAAASAAACAMIYIAVLALSQGGSIGGILNPAWLLLAAPFATGLTTRLVWAWKPGTWSGAAIGFLSHPVMWFLILAAQRASGDTSMDVSAALLETGVTSG